MNGFINELKRRNVVKVGIAYAVVAWVLIQAADILLPRFGAPEGLITGFYVLLGLGFPVALLLAWAFELTPEGVKKTGEASKSPSRTPQGGQKINKVIAGSLALALAFIAYDKFITKDQEMVQAARAGTMSIAVLPFADLSPAGDQGYFSDGMTEEILNALAKIPDLQVAARTSAFAYKGQNLDLRLVGKDLGVDYIVEGSVRRADNMVRITAQLIEVKGGFHLWSDTYDRELVNIFAVQEDLSVAIAEALSLKLNLSETPVVVGRTENAEAYDLYLQGLQHLRDRTSVPEGVPLLERAVELDPGFGPAWANLSLSLDVLPIYIGDEEEEALGGRPAIDERARQAAIKAFQLAPNSPAALHAMAQTTNDLTEATDYALRALEIDPSNTYVMEDLASYYFRAGLTEKAVEVSEQLVALDPIPVNILSYAMSLTRAGRYQEAIEQYKRGAEMNPAFGPFIWFGLDAFLLAGDYDGMEPYIRRFEGHYRYAAEFLQYVATFKADLKAHGRLTQTSIDAVSSERLGLVISITGGTNDEKILNRFLDHIGAGSFGQFHDIAFIFDDPRFNSVLQNPRFKAVVHSSGTYKFWKKYGFPPACRPVGTDDFECKVRR